MNNAFPHEVGYCLYIFHCEIELEFKFISRGIIYEEYCSAKKVLIPV